MRSSAWLFGHGRRVVAGDFPLAAIPAVGVGVAGVNFLAGFAICEGVQARVNRFVAVDLDVALIDLAGGFVRHEVHEVVFFFGRCQAGFVRYGGQQDGAFVVQGDNGFGVACLQGGVPTVKQGSDFCLGRLFADGGVGVARLNGGFGVAGRAAGYSGDGQNASREVEEFLHDDSCMNGSTHPEENLERKSLHKRDERI